MSVASRDDNVDELSASRDDETAASADNNVDELSASWDEANDGSTLLQCRAYDYQNIIINY